jgi:hypothetical protein
MKKSRLFFLLMAVLFLGACNSSKKCGCPTFKAQVEKSELSAAEKVKIEVAENF